MGRVIRHIDDWGSIIFCDERYSSYSIKSQLSAWLQPHIKIYNQFSIAYRENVKFFKNTGATVIIFYTILKQYLIIINRIIIFNKYYFNF